MEYLVLAEESRKYCMEEVVMMEIEEAETLVPAVEHHALDSYGLWGMAAVDRKHATQVKWKEEKVNRNGKVLIWILGYRDQIYEQPWSLSKESPDTWL